MRNQLAARSQQLVAKLRAAFLCVVSSSKLQATGSAGMTLIETLVAVTILALSIVAPMTLTMQSLSVAYYARDQIVMSNLAQEALESVRAVRDGNILTFAFDPSATCNGQPMDLLCGIPTDGTPFTVDARNNQISPPCVGECEFLKTDGNIYGHGATGWIGPVVDSPYRRTVRAEYIAGTVDEVNVTVTVEREGVLRPPPDVVLTENLFRWLEDGVAAP